MTSDSTLFSYFFLTIANGALPVLNPGRVTVGNNLLILVSITAGIIKTPKYDNHQKIFIGG